MMPTLVLLLPLAIAALIAGTNSDAVNSATEWAEGWIRAVHSALGQRQGWFGRLILRPVLGLIVRLNDWTDGFQNRALKNAVRAAAALYAIVGWSLLLLFALQIVVTVALLGVALYVAFRVLLSASPDVRRGYEMSQRILGALPPGHRIDPGSGVIQEEGLLGWRDTDQRIDPDTGNLQSEGLLGWRDSDKRVNQDTGVLQEEGLLGFRDTDLRISPETGVIQKQGLLGWQDTEERIDPKTGKRQRQGLLGWTDE